MTIDMRDMPMFVLDDLDEAWTRWKYEVLRLVPDGSPSMFSVLRMVFGDSILSDVRLSSTFGGVYQRVGDSRTATIRARGLAYTQLEPSGLFVAGARRVTFTPTRQVQGLFGAGAGGR